MLVALALVAGGCTGGSGQPSDDGTTLPGEDVQHRADALPSSTVARSHAALLGPRSNIMSDSITAAGPARVLVWHSHDPGQLISVIEDLGHDVIVSQVLPEDLSAFDVIWHVAGTVGLRASERERLAAFVAAGGGLHLTGERPCCDALTDSLTELVNDLVIADDDGDGVEDIITVGRQGDIFAIDGGYLFPYAVNPDAAAGAATTPQVARALQLAAAGGIAGLTSARNILVEGRAGSDAGAPLVPVGAIWDSPDLAGNAGRMTLLMDVNWFGDLHAADNAAMLENIQVFLQGGAAGDCPVAVAHADATAACALSGDPVTVSLDGTGSTSPAGTPLTYHWYEGDVLLAVGPTPTVTLLPGEHEITLVVDDGACTSPPATVRLSLASDEQPPQITLLGDDPAIVECGAPFDDPGATAQDLCSGDLSADIVTTSNVDTSRAGSYAVDYEVTDDAGLRAHERRVVQVQDTTPPRLEPVPMIKLWPPDHELHTFAVSDCIAVIDDTCDAAVDLDLAGRILSITSDEPVDAGGDGKTQGDIVILDQSSFQVRAERLRLGDGRVYSIDVEVTDTAGNTSVLTCRIGVPPEESGKEPVDSGAGAGYTVTAW